MVGIGGADEALPDTEAEGGWLFSFRAQDFFLLSPSVSGAGHSGSSTGGLLTPVIITTRNKVCFGTKKDRKSADQHNEDQRRQKNRDQIPGNESRSPKPTPIDAPKVHVSLKQFFGIKTPLKTT